MTVELTDHYKQRFKERQAKTKRMVLFTERAYFYGKTVDNLRKTAYARQLSESEQQHCSMAKIYNNFVYWFKGNVAITIYPVPQNLHNKI